MPNMLPLAVELTLVVIITTLLGMLYYQYGKITKEVIEDEVRANITQLFKASFAFLALLTCYIIAKIIII